MTSSQRYCSRGHEFTFENTVISKDGKKRCRACKNERNRRYRKTREPLYREDVQLPAMCGNGHPLSQETVLIWQNEWRCPQCRQYTSKRSRMKQYGISEVEYIELLESQGHQCPICERDFESTGEQPSIDHDHDTGAVRGLLCRQCNLGIGNLRDDLALVQNAYNYLLAHRLLG